MKFFLFFLFVIGILFPREPLFAASEQRGITVSPAFQEIILDQQDSEKDFVVEVTNDMDISENLHLSVLDFGSLDESGGVAFLGASGDLEKKYALASWMRPEKDIVILAPGETQDIRVTIENRDSLSPGGHYGVLVFQIGNDVGGDPSTHVSIRQLFTTLVFVKKTGGEIYQLGFGGNDFTVNVLRLPQEVKVRFQNSGNVHLTPRGIVTITDPLGRTVGKGIINEESGIILPETFRAYPVALKSLKKSFIPGQYTLTIAYRYDGKDAFETVETKLGLFIPVPTAVASLAILGALGWSARRRFRKQKGSAI